jgi:VCBS repeat-containing protein
MKTRRTILVLITVISLLITNVATAQALRPLPSGSPGTVNGSHAPVDTPADILAGNLPCGTDSTLVGCWQMEENGGTLLLDGSSYSNNATLYGGPAWVTGIGGSYAIDLNGTSQYATVPDNASLDIEDQITILAWIRPEQYATQDLIKKATQGSVNGYELSLATTKSDASSQRVFFRINQVLNGESYRINATTMYPIDGTWMHVAATYDGSVMRLYINGVEEANLTLPAGTKIKLNDVPLSIGAQSTPSRYFKGWMDDARIYHRALSPEEIESFINFSPVAVDDTYDTPEDTLLTVSAPGVLSNDTDADLDPLTAIKVTDPAHGSLALNPDGSFTYEPEANWNGSDSFTYKANDTQVDSNTATVTVNVSAVDDPPEVTDPGSQTSAEGDGISLQILATDLDSPTLAFSALNLPGGLSIDPDTGLISGSIDYHAAASSPYSASVTVTDGTTPVTVNFTWTVSQTAFGACAADTGLVACYQMEEGGGAFIYDGSPAGNDGTTTGGPTWVTGKTGPFALSLDGVTQFVSIADDDSLDLTDAFTIAGWIKPGKLGTQYLVKKAVHDGTNGYELSLSSSGKVFFRINQTTYPDDRYRINSLTSYPIDGNTWMHVTAIYSGGTMKLYIDGVQEGGEVTAPAPEVNTLPLTLGTQATSMRYFQGAMDDVRLYDRALSLDEIQVLAWMKPVVSGIPDQFIAEGTSFATIALDDYVTDADNSDDQMSWSYSGNLSLMVSIVDRVATIATPDADWNGTEVITFRATDPAIHSGEDAASFTVDGRNDAPLLGPIGPRNTAELVPLLFTAMATDIDLPADTLIYSLADGDDGSVPAGAGIDPDSGDFDWIPTEAQGPGAYTFDVCVSDEFLSNCETITVTVSEVMVAPIAVPDAYEVLQNGILMVDAPGVLANDSDADIPADTLSVIKVTGPSHGELLSLNASGLFVYRPIGDYIGMDAFTYKVSDGPNNSEVVSVNIRVYQKKAFLPLVILPFATPVLGLNHVPGSAVYTLSWNPIAGADDYKIWESTSPTSFPTDPSYVSGGSTSFLLPDLNPTRYYYYVVATNGYMDSRPSNTVTVDRQYELEPNDSGETANGPIQVNLKYHGRTDDDKDYYKIYISAAGTITVMMNLSDYPSDWPGQLQLFKDNVTIENRVDFDTDPDNGMLVTYTTIEPGWYYIMVGTDVTYTHPENWYAFTVTFTATP